ncbi:MAG: PAS domain S-box protein, partial [Byssovorax cruenta]
STTLQLDEQGNFMGGVAMVSDITERKQFEKALIEFARHQSALYGLADQLHRTNSLQEMYDASLNAIRKALLCDRASILIFDEGGVMRFVAWQGLSDEYRQATDGHSPWKPDEKNPVPIAIANIRTSDLSDSLKAVIQKEGIGSLAFIPILFQGRLIGKFMVYFNAPHIFSDGELNLSTTIARQLASVVDRKRNEYALRESQQRLALVYSNAAAGLVESSIDTRILECNDEFCKMTGYTREELLGRSFLDITDPEDRSTERELYQQLMTKQIPFYRLEKRYIKKDGSPTWCEVVRSVVLDENGEARFGLGAVFDSNERRQREEALRARTEEVEALMEVSPIGILVAHDAECMHITGNPAAYSILGFPMDSQENLSRSSLDTAVPSQSHRVFRDSTELAIHELPMQASARLGMEIEDEELELRFEDGSRKYVYFFAKPLFDPYGRSRGSVAAMLEITERKQNEEALKTARRKAEETASRIARLQKVTAALSGPLNSSQVAEVLATQGTTAFDAASGTVMMLSEDGQTLETIYSMLQGPVIDPYLRFPITLDVPAAEAVRTGRVVWIESREFYLEHYPHLADQINRWEYNAGMAVPLQYKGRISGVLILSFDHEMPFNLEDQEFALTLARQGAQALERARAEEALRESEQRYRAIINQTTVGIVRKDPQGNLLFVNEAFSEMLGYTSSELLGKSMWQLTHPDDAEENRRLYARMMKEGNPFEYEKRLIHHDGSIHWMMVSVSPLLDIQGRPESAVAVYADITLRKRFESELQRLNMELEARVQQRTAELQAAYESLRANEEKLRKVFEILPVGISFLGNEGQILEMNSALSNILGLSKRELMDGSFKPRRYIRPDGTTMPPSEFASTRALTEQKTVHNVETGILKENGQIIWTSVNAAPVDVGDVDVVIATIDITERKRAEDALHQNRERLKTLSRRLVEVQEEERQALARELHDRVGQNLAALNLNLNILRSQLSSEALQVIGTRLDDSVSLVNQILTITRNVMADLRSNVLDDYGLESALREYAEQFTQRTGVEVVSDKSGTAIPRLEPSIEMTLLRIAQEALTNVARHAQASKATISIRSDDETVYMSIQDDGIGILSWQKANQPGSHGLRIIRERAEAFGGSLTVHSTYKKGTRIEVKIPLVNTNSQNVSRKRRS